MLQEVVSQHFLPTLWVSLPMRAYYTTIQVHACRLDRTICVRTSDIYRCYVATHTHRRNPIRQRIPAEGLVRAPRRSCFEQNYTRLLDGSVFYITDGIGRQQDDCRYLIILPRGTIPSRPVHIFRTSNEYRVISTSCPSSLTMLTPSGPVRTHRNIRVFVTYHSENMAKLA